MADEKTTRQYNPIDKDKIAENPHLLPYAHTVGGAITKPIDKGRVKGVAMSAMYEQTNQQLNQIREQVERLVTQAQSIHDRIDISEKVYLAECGFKPVIGQVYNLYEKKDGTWLLSMISEEEWGPRGPYFWLATARLMHDHTWEILSVNKEKPVIEM
jgi:hypothetical protein